MLKVSAAGAGAFGLAAAGLTVPRGFGKGGVAGGGGGATYVEVFPTSPLILSPFTDALPQPKALAADAGIVLNQGKQDDTLTPPSASALSTFNGRYGWTPGTHQVVPSDLPPLDNKTLPDPIGYRINIEVRTHSFTSSQVQPIDAFGKDITSVISATGTSGPQLLPDSTIYGFNGTFPGPMINAEYGKPALVHFENHLDVDNGHDRMDFGAPNHAFLTHLHNGHTACESDGNPHYTHLRFKGQNPLREMMDAAYRPGEWVENLYLNWPAGGEDTQKQSFLWFHDHTHGHTGANVYKGMVGLFPIYDPVHDPGDEKEGLGLPGIRVQDDLTTPGRNPDGTFNVKYDIPMALYDVRIDDGTTLHHDAHIAQELPSAPTPRTHPEWWGRHFFQHFPNHGFVGDVFTVNGTAYPVLKVKRRKYRLRFLGASISRIYELKLMHSNAGPKSARSLGYSGDELQGQFRVKDAQQCMRWVQIANEGGLLPKPITRDSFEIWPAKRKEFIVDFTRYMDGYPTRAGDVIWMVNTMKMTTGRLWDSADAAYKVPMMKIVIEGEPPEADKSVIPRALRAAPDVPANAATFIKDSTVPTFELQRGSAPDPLNETEWLINGLPFNPDVPLITVKRGSSGYWRIRNGGGGWVHPMHLHQEEHMVIARNGRTTSARHPDDTGKEDVVALDPSEEVLVYRSFRTFTGPYVAHCHNLAHEDHNMMFGWEIVA